MNYEIHNNLDKIQLELEENDLQNNYQIEVEIKEKNYSKMENINLDRIRV